MISNKGHISLIVINQSIMVKFYLMIIPVHATSQYLKIYVKVFTKLINEFYWNIQLWNSRDSLF